MTRTAWLFRGSSWSRIGLLGSDLLQLLLTATLSQPLVSVWQSVNASIAQKWKVEGRTSFRCCSTPIILSTVASDIPLIYIQQKKKETKKGLINALRSLPAATQRALTVSSALRPICRRRSRSRSVSVIDSDCVVVCVGGCGCGCVGLHWPAWSPRPGDDDALLLLVGAD
jgi:hypothetical protein